MSAEVRVGDLCRGLQRLDSFMDSVRADNDLALGVVSACSLLFEQIEWSAEVFAKSDHRRVTCISLKKRSTGTASAIESASTTATPRTTRIAKVSASIDKMRPNPVKQANKRRAEELHQMLDEVDNFANSRLPDNAKFWRLVLGCVGADLCE